jgi:uncharacterized protein YprB with RNaseH-like and TPR domain
MIRHTFSIAPSIGVKKEKRIWESGIRDWDDFLSADSVSHVSAGFKKKCDAAILEAEELLDSGDAAGLNDMLPGSERWRLFGEFGKNAAYLDIETDGLERTSLVTVVTIHTEKDTVTLTQGKDLDAGTLSDALDGVSMLVTFNGSCFDIPVLRESFPTLDLEYPHFDLRFGARKAGYRGGSENHREPDGDFQGRGNKGGGRFRSRNALEKVGRFRRQGRTEHTDRIQQSRYG